MHKRKQYPQESNWITVIHAGYKVVQRRLTKTDIYGRKYERTYYSGAHEVLHEVGDYMTENELMDECSNLTELLQALHGEMDV